jgi:phage shock protein A
MKMIYWIVIGAVIASLLLAYSWGRYHPSEDLINNIAEKTRQETVKQYEQRIVDLDSQLKASQKEYRESQQKYTTIIKKLNAIKEGKDNVKPPQNTNDLINRFDAAGYTPVGK